MKTAKTDIFCDICFFLALVLKLFSLGITYFPVLDDYIQYGGYPLYENLSHVYLKIGTIATRPAAALLDPAVWGQTYPKLFIALFIISVLFFFGVRFISLTLEKLNIHIRPFLYAIVLLLPLGFEGTYWISASSRICVGLFFAGLSAFLLEKIITQNKKKLFFLYALTTLLSFGFYESVMVFSALLQFFVILALSKSTKRRLKLLLTPVILGIAVLLYYIHIGNISTLGSRVNSFEFSMLPRNIERFFAQFYDVLVVGGMKTTVFGAIDGVKIIASLSYGLLLAILIVLLSGACAYFGGKMTFAAKAKFCIPLGLVLIFLPLLPNLLTEAVWLTYRSIVVSLFGLVILSASILSFFLKNRKVRTAIIFVMVCLFTLGNVSELNTYKKVNETDNLLVSEICRQLDDEVLSGTKNVIVVTGKEIVVPQVSYYKDHVKSVFDSDWALTGAVRAKTRNINIKMITPVLSLEGIDAQGKQIIYLGGNNG